jgi:hypothetical protein
MTVWANVLEPHHTTGGNDVNGISNLRTVSASAKAPRDPAHKATDKAALQAIAQAAVEVELFTIPLYMTALYSIQGMHQITSKGNDFYKGRLWPGSATTAQPATPNDKAFNVIFSVLIQEMLHLQLASNMATAIGVIPKFTSSALQSSTHGWTCYAPTSSTIPHIIDLKDTTSYSDVIVNVGGVTREQLRLFLAIEQPEDDARKDIKPDRRDAYFPKVPFADWKKGDPLPMFGTIGWMYQCYLDYLHVQYTDGTNLWDAVYNPGGQQNDLFNNFGGSGHPMREFMGFESTIALTYSEIAFNQMADMMNAITDQGEGSILKHAVLPQANLQAVKERYQPSFTALESDYPDYNDDGTLTESADAPARFDNDNKDHYERFQEVMGMLGDIVIWPDWLKKHGPWTAADLQAADYQPPADQKIPAPADVAAALNTLASPDATQDYYKLLSQAAIGAIAGVTTVLDSYWSATAQSKTPVSFPFPSMVGSGDRMAICWAVFGKAPDLSIGLAPPQKDALYHSCQALDYTAPRGDAGTNQCAPVEVFHSCKGSNGCRAQGGCGFVQPVGGGGNCSTQLQAGTAIATRTFGAGCNPFAGQAYSAPGDNKCGTFGGCAVPISASQLFPRSGNMQLFSFEKDDQGKWTSVPVDTPLLFATGESVHDIAWKAYKTVMKLDASKPPPPPSPLRLAFPPST